MANDTQAQSDNTFRNGVTAITIALIVLIGVYMVQQSYKPDLTSATEDLAKCLNNTGAVMYGTSWCHFCQQQKTMFAPYFEYITFVDCDLDSEACRRNGVSSYPTWIINGKQSIGLQSVKQLAEASGCKI
jgi:glutaredoxin